MDRCEYFIDEWIPSKSSTLHANRNPQKPHMRHVLKCNHKYSKHREEAITRYAVCNGNIDECDIPENER